MLCDDLREAQSIEELNGRVEEFRFKLQNMTVGINTLNEKNQALVGEIEALQRRSRSISPTPTSNASGKVLAGHISSTATANTILSTEVIRDPSSFGDIVRGLHVYGAKVLRPEALVSAFYVID